MADKPKSSEPVPGPGFQMRTNIRRPSKNVVGELERFDTDDVKRGRCSSDWVDEQLVTDKCVLEDQCPV